jgi:hypothetical protein
MGELKEEGWCSEMRVDEPKEVKKILRLSKGEWR